ncbi:MAG: hypothetical protein ACFFCS_01765 [Candidatus Hodarchaeota archaeon]
MSGTLESALQNVEMLRASGQVKMALSTLMQYLGDKAKHVLAELGRAIPPSGFFPAIEGAFQVLGDSIQDEGSTDQVEKAGIWLKLAKQYLSSGDFEIALNHAIKVARLSDSIFENAQELKEVQQKLLMQQIVMNIITPSNNVDGKLINLAKNIGYIPREYNIPSIYKDGDIQAKSKSAKKFTMVLISEACLIAIWSVLGFPNSPYNLVAFIISVIIAYTLWSMRNKDSWKKNIASFSLKFTPKKRAIFLIISLMLISFIPLYQYEYNDTMFFPGDNVYFSMYAILDPRADFYFKGANYIPFMKWTYILLIALTVFYVLYSMTTSVNNDLKRKRLEQFNWCILLSNAFFLISIMLHCMDDLYLFLPITNFSEYKLYLHVAFYVVLLIPIIVS